MRKNTLVAHPAAVSGTEGAASAETEGKGVPEFGFPDDSKRFPSLNARRPYQYFYLREPFLCSVVVLNPSA